FSPSLSLLCRLKYIDDEIARRKGKQDEETVLSEYEAKIASLYKIPEKYQVEDSKRSEDMLSNQMLSGIPEVDLGLDAKFKNIEETEIAKKKMAEDKLKMKDKQTSMIPTNFASNFTHHSLRFFKDRGRGHHRRGGGGGKRSQEEEETESRDQPSFIPVVGSFDEPELKPTTRDEGGGGPNTKKRKPGADHSQLPTDDYHFDKFRKKAKSHR
uniref:Uncharacterized protein n=1 Tax=Amphimedon queenslandica TaxID=400682 RepID=A0A1X7UGC7_AMPQE